MLNVWHIIDFEGEEKCLQIGKGVEKSDKKRGWKKEVNERTWNWEVGWDRKVGVKWAERIGTGRGLKW